MAAENGLIFSKDVTDLAVNYGEAAPMPVSISFRHPERRLSAAADWAEKVVVEFVNADLWRLSKRTPSNIEEYNL